MPIYEFVCSRCRHEYEMLVPRVDATAPCPECGSEDVERAISRPAAPQISPAAPSKPCGPGG